MSWTDWMPSSLAWTLYLVMHCLGIITSVYCVFNFFFFWAVMQAVDMKLLASLTREDLKKICGDTFPEWISFPVFEQVS